jgi:hypothetical protein
MQMRCLAGLLLLPCAAAFNVRPPLSPARVAQPVVASGRAAPLVMADDDIASLQAQIQRLQLQAEIQRLQAQLPKESAPEPPIAADVSPPPQVVAGVAPPAPVVPVVPEVVAPPVPEVVAPPVPEVVAPPVDALEKITKAAAESTSSWVMPSFDAAPAATAAAATAATAAAPTNGGYPVAIAVAVTFLVGAGFAVRQFVVMLSGGEGGPAKEAESFMFGARRASRKVDPASGLSSSCRPAGPKELAPFVCNSLSLSLSSRGRRPPRRPHSG